MEEIIGISASAAGGGVFGLVGTTLGRIAGFFEKRQTIAHEERRWLHDTAVLKLQQSAAQQTADADLAKVDAQGRWTGLQASLNAEAAIGGSYKWVDAARALTRPLLTVMLWIVAGVIWFSADVNERVNIVEATTFAATAATLWWFGDRISAK